MPKNKPTLPPCDIVATDVCPYIRNQNFNLLHQMQAHLHLHYLRDQWTRGAWMLGDMGGYRIKELGGYGQSPWDTTSEQPITLIDGFPWMG